MFIITKNWEQSNANESVDRSCMSAKVFVPMCIGSCLVQTDLGVGGRHTSLRGPDILNLNLDFQSLKVIFVMTEGSK